MRSRALGAMIALTVFAAQQAQSRPPGITSVEGIRVGHHTLTDRPAGCTVVLVEKGATAGVAVPAVHDLTRK